jgi:TonB family protein
MGYQALLFCTEEKLARVVTQVFTELEFNVEPVNEPFSAVKKLMAQHYDAIVVDCENEQNASLLFKSARNSGANLNSLALALVEGQTGVAKAYRIGANLVLTKPINVEQAKGTLRVARGLLRKNADAGVSAPSQPSPPGASMPAPPVSPAQPESATMKPLAFAAAPPAALAGSDKDSTSGEPWPAADSDPPFTKPEFKSDLPAMAALAGADETMSAPLNTPTPISGATDSSATTEAAVPQISKPTAMPGTQDQKPAVSFGSLQGAAAAPAPAKEMPTVKAKAGTTELFASSSPKLQPAEIVAPPKFSALDEESSAGTGSSKKFLAIAAAFVIAAGAGYFGWTKFGRTSTGSQSPSAVQSTHPTPAPALPTASAPSTVTNSTTTVAPAQTTSLSTLAPGGKATATVNSAPIPKIAVGTEETTKPEVVTKTFAPAPLHVMTQSPGIKVQRQSDDLPSPVPDPLGVGSGKDTSLASLVSGPANLPAPPGTLKISQGVSQGLLIKKVQPVYPPNAKSMRLEGVVEMEALIDKEGKITNLKVVKGQAVLAHAAVDAVRQWRYKPYYLNGQPVEIETQITVLFRLPN